MLTRLARPVLAARLGRLARIPSARHSALPYLPPIGFRRHAATATKSSAVAPPSLLEEEEELDPVTPQGGITLRPYQERAIQACVDALENGQTRIGVSSPTGSGKTTMFMRLIPRIPCPNSRAAGICDDGKGQTLILVGSVELALQAERAARRLLGPDWTVEIEQSKRVSSGRANVTIATYQTLTRNEERLLKFKPEHFKLVIVDEAHHSAAKSYMRILHYFNSEVELPQKVTPLTEREHGNLVPIIGFSATFSRADEMALNMVFQEIVFHRSIASMLEEGW